MLLNLFVFSLTLHDVTFIEFPNWASSYFVANVNFLVAKLNKLVAFAIESVAISSPVRQLFLDNAERGCGLLIEKFLTVSV